jgi:SAM-dependent methyltransferase
LETKDRERIFFDAYWQQSELERVTAKLEVPGLASLAGLHVLICSCGSGHEPVMAANAGAIVSAFDISPIAVANAQRYAAHNGVCADVRVMDFHQLEYADESFDVITGSAVLHHVDCARAGPEIWRCLAPGGIAYFRENSDRNPLLRLVRRTLFGRPGEVQRTSFLGLRRQGTTDEYPLTEAEIAALDEAFDGRLVRLYPRFVFFELLAIHGWRNARFWSLMRQLDRALARVAPFLRPWSFLQDVWAQKPARG